MAGKDFCDQAEIQAQCRYIDVDNDEGDGVKVGGGKVKFCLHYGCSLQCLLVFLLLFFLAFLGSLTFTATSCIVLEFSLKTYKS